MTKIIVGFSKPKKFNLISFLIRLIEKTNFSHAYIKIASESLKRNLIYQANNRGVWFIGENTFLENNIEVENFEFEITNEHKVKLLQFCIDNSGKKYAILQLIGMCFNRIFKINNPFGDKDRRYICTELVSAALNQVGFPEAKDLDNIGIKELYLRVKELKNA